ncbi:MAG TPA: hypothetical protein VHT51_21570 [Micropepsaceae bacterium]|jgi:hypothetical protein|nr:hypothetical protein [Micropepsaceae bacterium]
MLPGLGQRLGAHAISGALLLITASALIWVGVGFAGYAIYIALIPRLSAPWAAAIAAAILVVGPLGWAIIVRAPSSRRAEFRLSNGRTVVKDSQDATLDLLAKVAQEKPLLAMVFAGILGASEAVLHRKE